MPDSILTPITPDLYQLRLPLPFALNHVNVYLLRGTPGWTVLDCGINWQPGRDGWKHAFETLKFTPADIEKIVLTHVHPDHVGLAGWLIEQAAAAGKRVTVYVSPTENRQFDVYWRNTTAHDFGGWLRENGMPEQMATSVRVSMDSTLDMTLPHPPALTLIEPDTTLTLGDRTVRAIHAPGHSDGQLIFYDASDRLLLSGDHVLMTITPNIGLWEWGDQQPLDHYLESLDTLQALDVRLALPGHRRMIEDWRGRIAELQAHHATRLALAVEAVERGLHTPYAIAGHLFETGRFSAHEWRFAIAETLAHLARLEGQGIIVQDDGAYVLAG